MKLFWFSAILVVVSNVSYHLCQKSIPSVANPLVSVAVTFLVAAALALALLPWFPSEGTIVQSLRSLNWASVVLGLTIVGLETGYLLLYRSGWRISIGPLFCDLAMMLILIPIGLVFYREKLLPSNYAGIIFSFIGIYLLTRK